MRRTLGAAAVLVAIGSMTLAGCSDGPDTNEPSGGLGGNTQTFDSQPNSSSSASGTSSPSSDITCGSGAVDAARDAVSSFDEVTDVTVDSDCENVAIVTSLDTGGAQSEAAETAVQICEAAAADVYTDGITTLTVEASNADVLASASEGTDCTAG